MCEESSQTDLLPKKTKKTQAYNARPLPCTAVNPSKILGTCALEGGPSGRAQTACGRRRVSSCPIAPGQALTLNKRRAHPMTPKLKAVCGPPWPCAQTLRPILLALLCSFCCFSLFSLVAFFGLKLGWLNHLRESKAINQGT